MCTYICTGVRFARSRVAVICRFLSDRDADGGMNNEFGILIYLVRIVSLSVFVGLCEFSKLLVSFVENLKSQNRKIFVCRII